MGSSSRPTRPIDATMEPAPSTHALVPWPGGRAWWALVNRPRSFDLPTVRLGCGLLAVGYVLQAVLRHDAAHPSFFWARSGQAALGLAGVVLAPRFTFGTLRVYTIVLAISLSMCGAWVAAVLGQDPMQLPLTGLATFVGMAFLQTGPDILLVAPLVALGHAALLVWWPPVYVRLGSVIVMIGSGMVSGAVTSLLVTTYNARLEESLRWWRDACERERAALRTKGAFLNTMSHELRSPLHVIVGYADVLADDASPGAKAPLARIRASALELLQLVENTMNASRLEAGKLTLQVETIDPRAVLHELAENVAALPEAKSGVPIRWQVPAMLPSVRLDRLKFKEIVQNLVSNALKFTRAGTITVTAAANRDALLVAVEDTGPGIPVEAQGRVFEMFERLSGEGEQPPGVGLGLYIVRELVALMGGTITVASTPGVGTCFTVRLPLAAAAVRVAA